MGNQSRNPAIGGPYMDHMMNWDDIRHFLAVARGGSVRAAAASLKVGHSTVLRHIAQLEETLGTPHLARNRSPDAGFR